MSQFVLLHGLLCIANRCLKSVLTIPVLRCETNKEGSNNPQYPTAAQTLGADKHRQLQICEDFVPWNTQQCPYLHACPLSSNPYTGKYVHPFRSIQWSTTRHNICLQSTQDIFMSKLLYRINKTACNFGKRKRIFI